MNVFYVLVLLVAMAAMECMIGGTRLLFCLPPLAIVAVGAIASLRDVKRGRLLPDGACLIATTIFFGYMIARAFLSPAPYLAASDLATMMGALMVYLLVACHLVDPRRRLWVLAGLLLIAAVNLAVGARQFSSGTGEMLFGYLRSDDYLGRASGLYICPNHLAGYLEVVGSLTLAAAFWARLRAWLKILLGYFALCCFAGLLLTGSRGGFISTSAALLTLTFLGLWRARETSPETFKRILLLVVILIALAAGGVTLAVKNSRLIEQRGSHLLSKEDARLLLWPAAVKQFQTSPWIGTGSGTYLYYGRLFRDPRVQMDPIHTHNDYLQLLAEYGVAGVAGLLLLFGAHVRWGLRAYRHLSLRFGSTTAVGGSNAASLNIGALTAFVALAVHSVVDFNLHIPANALLMAFVFGILANPGRELSEAATGPVRIRAVDWLPRLALPALGVFLLAWGVPKLPGEYYCEKARVALRDNQPMAALHQAELGLERERDNPYLYFYLGEARRVMADRMKSAGIAQSFRQAAIEPYQKAVKLFPEDVRLLLRLGQVLTEVGNFPEADKVMKQAVVWDPNSGNVQTYYGYYLQRSGKLSLAEAAYQKALMLNPNADASQGKDQVRKALAADAGGL